MNIDMDLLNIFRRPKPQTRVEAVAHEIRKHSRALIEIDEQSRAFYRQDIGRWRRAHEAAADVENPRRADLYNVYADVVLNTQVEGCMRQIETAVMQRRFYIRSEKTAKELPEKTSIISCPWFRDLMHHALEAEAWGNSLVELGNVVEMRGRRTIDSVHLIPREHVVPEYGLVLKDINDDLSMGIDYRNNPRLNRFLIDINADEPLGFLLKVAPEAISIKNMSGFWDSFGELFGIPVRWATTTSTDDSDKATIMSALRQMGAAAFGLFPEGTEIKFLETQRGDAFQVFDQRIARAQTNISKAILNQTMTIDDGSSLSQSETHLDIFNRVVHSRMAMIASMVNWQLLPKLQEMGLPFTDDDEFVWDEAVSYTPEQQLQIEQMILANYEVDPAYFKEKYNIEITGVKQQAAGLFATAELKKKSPAIAELDRMYGQR